MVPSPIPAALERLVMTCIARDVSARPQSIAEIVDILESIQDAPVWTQQMAQAWWARCAPGLVEAQDARLWLPK